MRYYFAPMEGVTGAVYRRAHHAFFPGIDRYFLPFITPTATGKLTPRQKREVAPDANEGVPVVPQLLTRNAADFIWCANALFELGYGEVNLNLGCPSGTVTAKGKGAGFLGDPDGLDRFFDAVFSACTGPISVKTRLGLRDPAEFDRLLAVYDRYPICALTVHPRVRQDFYKGAVREAAFAAACEKTRLPLVYNGDLVCQRDVRAVEDRYPGLAAVMIGRGLIADPSLVTQLCGGPRADKRRLRAFHDAVYEGYCRQMDDRRVATLRMKELWFYQLNLFAGSEKPGKAIRKAGTAAAYEQAVAALFDSCDLLEQAVPAWFRPAD